MVCGLAFDGDIFFRSLSPHVNVRPLCFRDMLIDSVVISDPLTSGKEFVIS
jgi:hypothetical protein